MTDTIIVIIIFVLAVIYIAVKMYRSTNRKGASCCGDSRTACSSCPLAESCTDVDNCTEGGEGTAYSGRDDNN